jgi:rubrerythrin
MVRRADEARALAVVDEYEEAQIQRGERPNWVCPGCGATVLGALDDCPTCEAVRPGTEEPDSESEDDVPPANA